MRSSKGVGEFAWIRSMTRALKTGPGTRVGIGDDAAVLKAGSGRYETLFTTDMLIEGKHFRFGKDPAYWIGRKAMTVNVSDIAAMGGEPVAAVVSLGVPDPSDARRWQEIFRGMGSAARRFHFDIVGGDTNASPLAILSVAMIGRVRKGSAILRSGARPGDHLFVTGRLGGSLASGRHLSFEPRLREARYLMDHFKPHAMMDLSDGLASDLRRLTDESRVGARIEERLLPRHKGVGALGALGDGEDFELLIAIGPSSSRRLKGRWPSTLAPLTQVGLVTERSAGLKFLKADGREIALPNAGFDHFR